MIELNKLTKRFGDFVAVSDMTFTLKPGEVLGFLGPNGAGKSTTMKMLTGFLPIDQGSATICGFDISKNPEQAKAAIGYLPEGAPAWGDMTPLNFLDFIARVRGLSGKNRTQAIDRAIAKTHLEPVLHRPIENLSKGYKRRVGLAQAILHDPEVLILDEPTDGLDPNQKHQVRELIRDMAPHKTIIVSTHILEEVETICTRALIIAQGQKLFDGTPAELSAKGPLDQVFRTITKGAL